MIRDNQRLSGYLGGFAGFTGSDGLRLAGYESAGHSKAGLVGVPTAINGTWADDTLVLPQEGFTLSAAGVITYDGATSRIADYWAYIMAEPSSAVLTVLDVTVAVNGVSIIESTFRQWASSFVFVGFNIRWPVLLETGDTVELFFTNQTNGASIAWDQGRQAVG